MGGASPRLVDPNNSVARFIIQDGHKTNLNT